MAVSGLLVVQQLLRGALLEDREDSGIQPQARVLNAGIDRYLVGYRSSLGHVSAGYGSELFRGVP